jgi:hypothetical protein
MENAAIPGFIEKIYTAWRLGGGETFCRQGPKVRYFFLDRSSTCLKHSIYEAFYPVIGFESGFTGF